MPRAFYAFDFDGVIADSLPIALEEYRRLISSDFQQLPLPESSEDLTKLFPGPLRTSLRRFGLNEQESKSFFDKHSAAMRERSAEVGIFSDVAELILRLPVDSFAIVTSAYGDAVRRIFADKARSALAENVQIVGRERSLPKDKKFKELAEVNKVELSRMIKIGDMASDILYARSAAVGVWAVGWGYHPISYLAVFDPDECFPSQHELCAKIEGWQI